MFLLDDICFLLREQKDLLLALVTFILRDVLVEAGEVVQIGLPKLDGDLHIFHRLKFFSELVDFPIEFRSFRSRLCRAVEKMEIAFLRISFEERTLQRGAVYVGIADSAGAVGFKRSTLLDDHGRDKFFASLHH